MPKQVAPKNNSFDIAGAWGGKAQELEEGCHPEEEEREEGWKQARAMKYFVKPVREARGPEGPAR